MYFIAVPLFMAVLTSIYWVSQFSTVSLFVTIHEQIILMTHFDLCITHWKIHNLNQSQKYNLVDVLVKIRLLVCLLEKPKFEIYFAYRLPQNIFAASTMIFATKNVSRVTVETLCNILKGNVQIAFCDFWWVLIISQSQSQLETGACDTKTMLALVSISGQDFFLKN